eukprot:3591971-Prymnesium_polylepis.1
MLLAGSPRLTSAAAAARRAASGGSSRRVPLLSRLLVADDPARWAAAGFAVEGTHAHVGGVGIDLIGREASSTSMVWLDGSSEAGFISLDGIDTRVEAFDVMGQTLDYTRSPPHSNRAFALHSIVVTTPDIERSVEAMGRLGPGPPASVGPSPYSPDLLAAVYSLGSPVGQVVL